MDDATIERYTDANLGLDELGSRHRCDRDDLRCVANKMAIHRIYRDCVHWQRFLFHQYLAAQRRPGFRYGRLQLKRETHATGRCHWYWNRVEEGGEANEHAVHTWAFLVEVWAHPGRCMHVALLVYEDTTQEAVLLPCDRRACSLLTDLAHRMPPGGWDTIIRGGPGRGKTHDVHMTIVPNVRNLFCTLFWFHVACNMTERVVESLGGDPGTNYGIALFEFHLADGVLMRTGLEDIRQDQLEPWLRDTEEAGEACDWKGIV